MSFSLTKELLEDIKSFVEIRNTEHLRELFAELHPADIAEIIDKLNREQAAFILSALEDETAAEVVTFLDEETREKFMQILSPKEIAEKVIDNLDSDDAADIISELPEEKQRKVLSEIEDYEQAKDIADLLNYDEDSAGGLMAKELVKVNLNSSLIQTVREIRKQAEEIDDLFAVYVVDDRDVLLGILPIKNLLLAPNNAKLEDIIIKEELVAVNAHEKGEKVAEIMRKYDLVVLPVVDGLGRLIGRITIDDVVDVMQEEAEKDYQLASGISEDVGSDDKVWLLSRARLPWLLIGLLGGIVGSRVIGQYEAELQLHPEMAFFIPLIAAMGGNAGVQSSAIIVQSLAGGTISTKNILPRLFKELSVALISGLVCASVLLGYSLIFTDSFSLSMTVSISLITVIVLASIMGTFIPLMLDRFKIDPALATGPFITTSNDIIGLFVYFSMGRLLYGVF
ncbi:MAG: magnesium transporter [Flavobacteriales bacterium]|nr:magnesium transporter [Flavobacteriales bacterium]